MRKNIPKVSIVIPSYNLGQFLEEAIISVECQTYKNWELIVVDDGSTDKTTLSYLERLKKDKPFVIFIQQKNQGVEIARNNGIKKSLAEYIICLDSDDKLQPTYIEKCLEILEEDKKKELGFVTTWVREFGDRGNLWKTGDFNIPTLLTCNIVKTASMFRKEAWEGSGGYDSSNPKGYEDWGFWISIVSKGYKWATIHEELFLYRIREGSGLQLMKENHPALYAKIYSHNKKLFEQYSEELINNFSNESFLIQEKTNHLNELNKSIEEKDLLIKSLQEKTNHLNDELNHLLNSKIITKAIASREIIGKSFRAYRSAKKLPYNIAHKTRVVVAPIIPPKVRKKVKKSYKSYLEKRTEKIIFNNEKWPSNLPIVSVIIPYYNRADTIDETLGSLDSQTFKNFETILVDDGSNEQSSIDKINAIKEYRKKITVISQKNNGVSSARNKGIASSRGKYIICLDSDDLIDPTFIEKAVIILETNPGAYFVTTFMEVFGTTNGVYEHSDLNPVTLLENNTIITASMFRKEVWQNTGGYKSGIGYEDWEFWINANENGYFGYQIKEPLFKYRTALTSRYIDDKGSHWKNTKLIKGLHPNYKKNLKKQMAGARRTKLIINPETAFINLSDGREYAVDNTKEKILIAVPWMTFGGAETLIYNFCNEVSDKLDISFITGLESDNEWEYKFKEITSKIYHLPNIINDKQLYEGYISNYVKTRQIRVLHIIHTDFIFSMLETIKNNCPDLKIIVTMFNARVGLFSMAIKESKFIDAYSTDNNVVMNEYKKLLSNNKLFLIPNGIDGNTKFNPNIIDAKKEKEKLGVENNELSVFFIGRLSPEKNPDVFVEVAHRFSKKKNIKFYIVGDGPMNKSVSSSIKSLGIESTCIYLGYQTDIPKYLSIADIFVLPSSIEGFPLSILEAMSMEVAVVASRVGAVPDIINSGNNGFVVSPGSVNEIVESVQKLIDNPKLLLEVKENARRAVEDKYTSKILGKNYIKMYKEVEK